MNGVFIAEKSTAIVGYKRSCVPRLHEGCSSCCFSEVIGMPSAGVRTVPGNNRESTK